MNNAIAVRSPAQQDPATHADCLQFIRVALASNDREVAQHVAAILKDCYQRGYVDRVAIWDDLTRTEQQNFKELLALPPTAQPEPQTAPFPIDGQAIRRGQWVEARAIGWNDEGTQLVVEYLRASGDMGEMLVFPERFAPTEPIVLPATTQAKFTLNLPSTAPTEPISLPAPETAPTPEPTPEPELTAPAPEPTPEPAPETAPTPETTPAQAPEPEPETIALPVTPVKPTDTISEAQPEPAETDAETITPADAAKMRDIALVWWAELYHPETLQSLVAQMFGWQAPGTKYDAATVTAWLAGENELVRDRIGELWQLKHGEGLIDSLDCGF
ncbi:hypothetical protein [Microcoleus sp. T3_D1]|uniref:hypothetical protein n=1 Tax=Microcoleus sp. T3_D1 TaxID=3055427 RepID=UPI002FD1E5F6